MIFFKLLPVILSFIMLAAHFSRNGDPFIAYSIIIATVLVFIIKKKWVVFATITLLCFASAEWGATTFFLSQIRIEAHMPWHRMALILSGVSLFSLLSTFVFKNSALMNRYSSDHQTPWPSYWSFLLTFVILFIAKTKVSSFSILLADRFLPGAGIFEILVLSIYSALITEKMILKGTSRIRSGIWKLFSIVFFAQLLLGLIGIQQCLMTGKLHLPVPALIAAGPVYRGHSFFMPILFLVTIALSGPAWCSYFCYLGAWDDKASKILKKPVTVNSNNRIYQLISLITIVTVATIFRFSGVSSLIAIISGSAIGITGIAIMVFISRKRGSMIHCTYFCPVGFLAVALGKLNPFRIHVSSKHCTHCMKCVSACRYQALSEIDVSNLKPSLGCTLCGDCIDSCPHNALNYSMFHRPPSETVRVVFIIIATVIHTVFLGTARI